MSPIPALVAMLLIGPAPVAVDESPSRAEYVKRAEPICKRGDEASDRILKGVVGRVKRGELTAAGRQVIRAADAFGKLAGKLAGLPRPSADVDRLERWFDRLGDVEDDLRSVGVSLEKEKRVRANHAAIQAERSANAANNITFDLGFRHCRLEGSRLT